MDDAPGDRSTKTEWAEDRTDWAEDRTVLANERTFAGWMRTGLASVAVAIGLKAVFGEFEPTWAAKSVASVFIAGALFIFWVARQNAVVTTKRMHEHAVDSQPSRRITLMAAFLAFGAVATGAILWML
jgi:putative membrane protein